MDADEIEKYVKAGKIGKEAKELAKKLVKIGEADINVAEEIEDFILSKVGKSGGLAFPVTVCVNEIAAHKTPDPQKPYAFKKGDVVKVDLGVHIEGYIADTALTIDLGNNADLLAANELALEKAIESIKKNKNFGEVGKTVEQTMKTKGYMPITNLAGHQIRRFNLHAGASVPNCETTDWSKFQKGEAYAIEPFATNGVGLVVGGAEGGIMKVQKPEAKPRLESARAVLNYIVDTFGVFEFSKRRVLKKYPDAQMLLELLKKDGVLYEYPILKEKSGVLVSQFEETILILDGKVIMTTE